MTSLFPDVSEDFSLGWLIAFVDGEGCFCVYVTKPRTTKTGYRRKGELTPSFSIGQDEQDILLKIRDFLGCGSVRNAGIKSYKLEVRDFDELTTVIVPFFQKNMLRTKTKKEAFERFVEICERMKQNQHKQEKGFEELSGLARLVNKTQNITAEDIKAEDVEAEDT